MHRHKAATEANRVALGSEVKELKKKHKVLKKQVEADDKAQKKGKVGGLGGFAKGISKALFKPNENSQPTAPPVEIGFNEAPPEYCDEKAEVNVAEADVAVAAQKANDREKQALVAREDAMEAKKRQEYPEIKNNPERLAEAQTNASALISKANLAVESANKAREAYEQLRAEFEAEQQLIRRDSSESVVVGGSKLPVHIHEKGHPPVKGEFSGIATQKIPYPYKNYQGDVGYQSPLGDGSEQGDGSPGRPVQPLFSTPMFRFNSDNRPRIGELKKLVTPLIKSHELEWATITESLVRNVDYSDAGMMLQALTQQLNNHPEALRHVTFLLYQASTNNLIENPLKQFFIWLRTKYRLTPRQKRSEFTRLLKGMCWNWYHNPADQIGEIIARTHLTWDQVAQDAALCEELKAAVGSKTEPSMFLRLSGTPIKQWYEQIMQIWNELKDSRNPTDAEPVEIYLQESTEEIEGLSAITKTQGIPQVKDTTPNFSGFDKDLKDVVSALQVTAKTLQESQTNEKPKVPDNQQNVERRRCFGCKQVGHIRANCPSKPQFNRQNGG